VKGPQPTIVEPIADYRSYRPATELYLHSTRHLIAIKVKFKHRVATNRYIPRSSQIHRHLLAVRVVLRKDTQSYSLSS